MMKEQHTEHIFLNPNWEYSGVWEFEVQYGQDCQTEKEIKCLQVIMFW